MYVQLCIESVRIIEAKLYLMKVEQRIIKRCEDIVWLVSYYCLLALRFLRNETQHGIYCIASLVMLRQESPLLTQESNDWCMNRIFI